MKQGGNHRNASGFTIVEVIIVLAVSSALLISAILLINGKEGKTQFITSVNSLKQVLQQTINETASGYFPGNGDFTCAAGTPPTISSGAAGQGTNGDCIFLGKALQFGSLDNANVIWVYTLAGNRQINNGTAKQEVSNLTEAYPQVVSSLTSSILLESGITPATMKYDTGNVTTGGVAFLSTLADYTNSPSCGGICSSSQGMQLWAIDSTALADTKASFSGKLNGGGGNYKPVGSGATVCFNSATSDQSAVFTIGGANNSQTVDVLQVQSGKCS